MGNEANIKWLYNDTKQQKTNQIGIGTNMPVMKIQNHFDGCPFAAHFIEWSRTAQLYERDMATHNNFFIRKIRKILYNRAISKHVHCIRIMKKSINILSAV